MADAPKDDPTKAAIAKAIEPVAADFAAASGRDSGRLSTGEALGKAVNIAANKILSATELLNKLTTFRTYVAGWQHVEENLLPRIKRKIERIPEENRQAPPLGIAGPVFEAAKYSAEEPILAEMFAELIAGTMDVTTAEHAHPSFVEIIKSLTSEEARILRHLGETHRSAAVITLRANTPGKQGYWDVVRLFSYVGKDAGVPVSPMVSRQLGSLCRLGLTEIPAGLFAVDGAEYEVLENAAELAPTRAKIRTQGNEVSYERRIIRATPFGISFYKACVCKGDWPAPG